MRYLTNRIIFLVYIYIYIYRMILCSSYLSIKYEFLQLCMVLLFYISEQKLFYEVSKLGYFMMISSGAIFFLISPFIISTEILYLEQVISVHIEMRRRIFLILIF